MSWEIFKRNILRYSNNPDSIKDIDQVAKFYAREYDMAVKRGYDNMNLVTLQKGNVAAMEKLFKIALQKGYKMTSPYDLVGEMGKGVIAYWSGGIMNVLPIPVLPAPGSVSNVNVVTNTVVNPGVWVSQPSTAVLLKAIPDDNYTESGASQVVAENGTEILADEDVDAGEQVQTLINNMGGQSLKPFTIDRPPLESEDTPIGDVQTYSGDAKQVKYIEGLDYDDNLTPHFKVRDLTIATVFKHKLKAQHGLSVDDIINNLKFLAVNILEPLYKRHPDLVITSGFRGTPSLAGRVSQHEKGEAVDIQIPGVSPQQYLVIANWVKANLPVDQMIFEHGRNIWLHISCSRTSSRQRGSMLTYINKRYEPGLRCYYT